MKKERIEIDHTEVRQYAKTVQKGGVLKHRFWAQRIANHIIRNLQNDLRAKGLSMVQVTEMPDCAEFRVVMSIECMVIEKSRKAGQPRRLFTDDEVRAIRENRWWGPKEVKGQFGKVVPVAVLTGIRNRNFYPDVE
jgi:hypothetical protein